MRMDGEALLILLLVGGTGCTYERQSIDQAPLGCEIPTDCPVDHRCDTAQGLCVPVALDPLGVHGDGDPGPNQETCTGDDCPGDCVPVAADEVCDEGQTDEDCDGDVDEPGADGCVVYHRDRDQDGFGDGSANRCLCAIDGVRHPDFTASAVGDCDDGNRAVKPGTPCDDGDSCTEIGRCQDGVCVPGEDRCGSCSNDCGPSCEDNPCCAETCEGPTCDACQAGCSCYQSCSAAAGDKNCYAHCESNAVCFVDAAATKEVELTCESGSSCLLDCMRPGTCHLTCLEEASCRLQCGPGSRCDLTCQGDADCQLNCVTNPPLCRFSVCEDTPVDCGEGVKACNRGGDCDQQVGP